MNKDLDKALKEKFLCQTKFTKDIEELVRDTQDLNYIDAIVLYCEENKIELESVSKLISKPLKEKIKAEAIELNFLKRTSRARLPL
jgi:Holliday junction resolvasome RuvABC ATP-dependent DNA helicase subunit